MSSCCFNKQKICNKFIEPNLTPTQKPKITESALNESAPEKRTGERQLELEQIRTTGIITLIEPASLPEEGSVRANAAKCSPAETNHVKLIQFYR